MSLLKRSISDTVQPTCELPDHTRTHTAFKICFSSFVDTFSQTKCSNNTKALTSSNHNCSNNKSKHSQQAHQKIPILWDVTLCHWMRGFSWSGRKIQWTTGNSSWSTGPFRMKAIYPFATCATTHPTTQRHIPEDQNPQLHLCENSSASITRSGRNCEVLVEWLPTVTITHYLYCSCTQTHLQFLTFCWPCISVYLSQ